MASEASYIPGTASLVAEVDSKCFHHLAAPHIIVMVRLQNACWLFFEMVEP